MSTWLPPATAPVSNHWRTGKMVLIRYWHHKTKQFVVSQAYATVDQNHVTTGPVDLMPRWWDAFGHLVVDTGSKYAKNYLTGWMELPD